MDDLGGEHVTIRRTDLHDQGQVPGVKGQDLPPKKVLMEDKSGSFVLWSEDISAVVQIDTVILTPSLHGLAQYLFDLGDVLGLLKLEPGFIATAIDDAPTRQQTHNRHHAESQSPKQDALSTHARQFWRGSGH